MDHDYHASAASGKSSPSRCDVNTGVFAGNAYLLVSPDLPNGQVSPAKSQA